MIDNDGCTIPTNDITEALDVNVIQKIIPVFDEYGDEQYAVTALTLSFKPEKEFEPIKMTLGEKILLWLYLLLQ